MTHHNGLRTALCRYKRYQDGRLVFALTRAPLSSMATRTYVSAKAAILSS